jgi:hypothetical protein
MVCSAHLILNHFTGQSEMASDLLGLIHTDVCGPMSSVARGGFQYFITFTDDFSRYLSLEFSDHLKQCGIIPQLTPPGMPQ